MTLHNFTLLHICTNIVFNTYVIFFSVPYAPPSQAIHVPNEVQNR